MSSTLEKEGVRETKKSSSKNRKKLKMIEDSAIRKFCMYLYKKFNLKDVQESTFYRHVHDTFIFLVSFIALFSMNLTHMTVLFIIVSIDAFAIIVRHGCPLTALERKYIKRSSCDDRDEILGSLVYPITVTMNMRNKWSCLSMCGCWLLQSVCVL